jgi:ABC-type bacteriocin/lantibiotic exporter with double-glycine peptidase domain
MKNSKSITKKSGWSAVFTLLKPKRIRLLAVATCTVAIYVTSLIYPLALQKVIDAALTNDIRQFHWMLACSIIAASLEIALSTWRLTATINLGAYLDLKLSGKLTKIVLSRIHTNQQLSPGSILNTTNQIKHIKDFILNTAPQTTLELGQAFISFILIANFSKTIAILVLAALILSALPMKLRSSELPLHLHEYNKFENQKQNTVSSLATSLKQIKHHALESFFYRKLLTHFKAASTSLCNLLKTSAAIQFWGTLTSRSLTFIVLISGCISVSQNELSIGEFMIIQLLASRLSSLLSASSDFISKYQEAKAALDRFDRFSELPAEYSPFKSISKKFASSAITISNIHSLHENGTFALANISINFPHSGLIALTGKSGSGKSSLIYTLLGIYGYSSGEIYYYGSEISTLNIRSVRRHISVADQDTYIFPGTLRENLCCGRTIDNSQIFRTLELVKLLPFIESLPEKLEYRVNENGRELSGGQKQKICLARALLRDNSCLILDEPTSALDKESSASILSSLVDLSKNHLIICITHEPEIMKKSDNVILMNHGSIIASGHHIELMKSCPDYRKIHTI